MLKRLVAIAFLCVLLTGCSAPSPVPSPDATSSDQVFATAFSEHQSGIQVSGSGTVTRILGDDNNGDRHQRFIVSLASGQTLLVAHNTDIAPRVAPLAEGDPVEFSGVYEWNEEGGVLHWTHHDPEGQHEAGWIKHGGTLYQ